MVARKLERGPETIIRDARAVELRAQHLTYQQIADALGMGNKSTAKRAVDRVMHHVQVEAAESYRASELAVLLALRNDLLKIFYAHHVHVSDGRVVREQGEAVLDHGPNIAAARELRANSESIRKLLGLDAPVKIDGKFTDATDAALEQLAAELAQFAEAGEAAAPRAIESGTPPAGH